MYKLRAKYEGLVPAMFNRFFNIEETEKPRKKKSKQIWKDLLPLKMYLDAKGAYVPSDNIRMMLIGNKLRKGAAAILGSYVEKAKGTEYKQYCESFVWVLGPEVPQKVYFEPLRKSYDDYDERSFIDSKGSRQITRRPLIVCPWSLSFTVQVTDDQMDQSKMKELFVVAGLRCGVGTYGPTFGRCEITEWEPI
jgi:hypothetical protein